MKILSFGEILFDIHGKNSCIGGAPFNFSAHAVRAGAEVSLLSCVGNDKLGKAALKYAEDYGVSTDFIAVSDRFCTGRCDVTLDRNGIPCYNLVADMAYDHIPLPNLNGENFDVLYFGSLALRGAENTCTLKRLVAENDFKEIFVDVNIRSPHFSEKTVLFALENATILKISDEEISVIGGFLLDSDVSADDIVACILQRYKNIKLLILTCGAKGAVAYENATGKVFRCDAVTTKVVSTVGAGDSFSATFLVNCLSGNSIEFSLKKAAEVSAYVVAHEGAIP